MSALEFRRESGRERLGLKGPAAFEWLRELGIPPPEEPNRWVAAASTGSGGGASADADGGAMLVARLGTSEFFIEDRAGAERLRALEAALAAAQPGVYPVLREDAGFSLSGAGTHEVLAQVCNVNFAELDPALRPVVMTLMIGVAVLVVPQTVNAWPRCRVWCDPTFAGYLEESLAMVVTQSGGNHVRST